MTGQEGGVGPTSPTLEPTETSRAGPLPTRAVRLRNGDTLISDQYNDQVIEVNHEKEIVRTFGEINSLGYNARNVADGDSTRHTTPSGSATTLALRRRSAMISTKGQVLC